MKNTCRHSFLAVLLGTSLSLLAAAQETTAPSAETLTNGLTQESLAAQRERVEQLQDLDPALRARILANLDDAAGQLRAAEEWRAKNVEFDRLRETAPDTLKEVEAELAKPAPEPPTNLPESVQDLEARLREAEAAVKGAQTAFDELAQELPRRAERRRAIPDLILAAQKRQQEAQANLGTPAADGESPYLEEARKTLARARLYAAQTEVAAYQQETLSYESRTNLLTRRQELAKRNLTAAQRALATIQTAAIAAREAEATAASDRARQLLEEIGAQNPAVKRNVQSLAERNATLADMRSALVDPIKNATDGLEKARQENKRLSDSMSRIQARVNAAGLDQAVGIMLRRAKSELPNSRALESRLEDRQERIVTYEIQRIDLSEERLNLADTRDVIDANLERLAANYDEAEMKELRTVVESFFQDQRELLDAAYKDTERYLDLLFDLNTEERQLVMTADEFEEYINKNILWIGGTDVLSWDDLVQVYPALLWAADPTEWYGTLPGLREDFQRRGYVYVFSAALVLALLNVRRRIKRSLKDIGAVASRKRHTHYAETLYALAYTVVLSLTIPSFFFVSSALLAGALREITVAYATAAGLMGVGLFLFMLEFVRAIIVRHGLAEAHFGWPRERVVPARWWLYVLEIGGCPFVFCAAFFAAQPNEVWQDSLGRLGLVSGILAGAAIGFILVRVLYRPLETVRRQNWPGDSAWTRYLVYALFSGIPLFMAGLATMGYFYTATQLSQLLFYTDWLVILVLLGAALARRWFLVTRRHVAVEQARKLRAAAKSVEDSDTPEVDTQEEAVDLVKVDAQTQRLVWSIAATALVVGCWFIWRDYVPALTNLDFQIYAIQEDYTEMVENDQGVLVPEPRVREVPIRFSHFVLLGFVILGTGVAVRNLPGLLELILLKRLAMGAGERYALLSIIQYIIVGIGIVIGFNVLGVGWSNLQWLIAALSLGLGFGLQEIFANFVSGIIILFERPVRLGDTVTVSGVSGVVTRIRIRATTITDFDRKELIVPNKEFITGQLVNWSLTDSILRIKVPIGIAYGSDTDKARRVLFELAKQLPNVLEEPAPQVLFLGFGDSTLNFELRIFSPDLDNYITLVDAAHTAVDKAFREHNIEIAFPQRDLHVRSGLEKLVTFVDREGNPPAE